MGNVPGRTLQVDHPPNISRGTRAYRAGTAVIDLIHEQWSQLVMEYNHCCAYCGTYCRNPTQDHLLPLSRGGGHTQSNVVPCCDACNSKKGNRTLDEFIRASDTTSFHPRLLEKTTMVDQDSITVDIKELHDDLGIISKDIRTLMQEQATIATKYENLAPRSYVDQQFSIVRQDIITLRADTAGRADMANMQAQLTSIRLLIEERLSNLAPRTEVIVRNELELRFKEIQSNYIALKAQVDGMATASANRIWDVVKSVLPYILVGATAFAAAQAHVVAVHP